MADRNFHMLKATARQALREARWRAGLSRRELADLTGGRVSKETIRNVELGENTDGHHPQTVYILAECLKLDAAPLFEQDVPA